MKPTTLLVTFALLVATPTAGWARPPSVSIPAISGDGKWVALPQHVPQPCGKVKRVVLIARIGTDPHAGKEHLQWDACESETIDKQEARTGPLLQRLLAGGKYRTLTYDEIPPKSARQTLDVDEVTFAFDEKSKALKALVGKRLVGTLPVPGGKEGRLYAATVADGARRWGYLVLRNHGDGSTPITDRWVAMPLRQLAWVKHPQTVAYEKHADAVCACTSFDCATKRQNQGPAEQPGGETRLTRKDRELIDRAVGRASDCQGNLVP